MSFVDSNWWLYVMISFAVLILVSVNVYIVVLWQHPDDKNEAYFPKFLVITGMLLAEAAVLLLPLDVANNAQSIECGTGWSTVFCGELDMSLAWYIVYFATFIYAFFIIPFSIFFYEEDDSLVLEGYWNPAKAFASASKYIFAITVIIVITVAVMYTQLGFTDIPVRDYEVSVATLLGNSFTMTSTTGQSALLTSTSPTTETFTVAKVNLRVYFPVYLMALMSFVGWFLFVFFGGLGLPGLPIDCIRSFVNRPQRLDASQIASLEIGIQRRTTELLDIGEMLKGSSEDTKLSGAGYLAKRRRRNREGMEFNRFKQMVYILEEDYDNMALCRAYAKSYNPLKPAGWLLCGILCMVITTLWTLQIILYMLTKPPVSPFLNKYFLWFDNWFPLFGVLSVFLFSMYLLVACIKGCFKFGLRLMWFTLHPMKLNGTYMNSFLFNVGIILLCSAPVVQFSAQAFRAYARNSTINNLFNVQVRYLVFFRYFYDKNVFIFSLLILTLGSFCLLSFKPADSPASAKRVKDAIKKVEAGNAR